MPKRIRRVLLVLVLACLKSIMTPTSVPGANTSCVPVSTPPSSKLLGTIPGIPPFLFLPQIDPDPFHPLNVPFLHLCVANVQSLEFRHASKLSKACPGDCCVAQI